MRRRAIMVMAGAWIFAGAPRAAYANDGVAGLKGMDLTENSPLTQTQAAQQAAQNYLQQSQQEFAYGAAAIANGLAAAKTACNKPLSPAPVAAADPPPTESAPPPVNGTMATDPSAGAGERGSTLPSNPDPMAGPTAYGSGGPPPIGATGAGGPGPSHSSVPEPVSY